MEKGEASPRYGDAFFPEGEGEGGVEAAVGADLSASQRPVREQARSCYCHDVQAGHG